MEELLRGLTWVDIFLVFMAGNGTGFVLGHLLGKRTSVVQRQFQSMCKDIDKEQSDV